MSSLRPTLKETPGQDTARPWYFVYRRLCVLCGAGSEHRERRHTPRPEDWNDRHEETEYACDEHFI